MRFTTATFETLRRLAKSTPILDSASAETLSIIMEGSQFQAAMQGLDDIKHGRITAMADVFDDVEDA
jgi:uncharacterized protein YhdP